MYSSLYVNPILLICPFSSPLLFGNHKFVFHVCESISILHIHLFVFFNPHMLYHTVFVFPCPTYFPEYSIILKSNLIRLQHSLLQCTGPCKGCACSVAQWCSPLCNHMDYSPPDSSVHGIFPGKNIGMGCHFLLQGIFLTQWWNLHLHPHCCRWHNFILFMAKIPLCMHTIYSYPCEF